MSPHELHILVDTALITTAVGFAVVVILVKAQVLSVKDQVFPKKKRLAKPRKAGKKGK